MVFRAQSRAHVTRWTAGSGQSLPGFEPEASRPFDKRLTNIATDGSSAPRFGGLVNLEVD